MTTPFYRAIFISTRSGDIVGGDFLVRWLALIALSAIVASDTAKRARIAFAAIAAIAADQFEFCPMLNLLTTCIIF